MKIKYYRSIRKNKSVNRQVLDLLKRHDSDFVPPLSSRGSTTQSDLTTSLDGSILEYFNEMLEQEFFIAFDGKKVVGFMSFKRNYISRYIDCDKNIYISTIIVNSDYRGKGITKLFYKRCLQKFRYLNIYTRTWAQNASHIFILTQIHFTEVHRLPDDRGPGIDTVYFGYQRRKKTFGETLSHHKLWGSILFLATLILLTILSFIAMAYTKDELWFNIWSSIATSFSASFLCLACDTVIRYRDAVRDEYMNSLKNYGISSLRFEKSILLESLIPKAKDIIWISGYRLKMTSKYPFQEAIKKVLKNRHNLQVRVLLVPPFSPTYKKVYGDDDVYFYYMTLFKNLKEYGGNDDIQIHVTNIPLFNDTYRVDSRIVTSPYMHSVYNDGKKLEAKDFFTIDVTDESSRLHELISSEYELIWNSHETQNFDFKSFLDEDICKENWLDVFQKHCKPLSTNLINN